MSFFSPREKLWLYFLRKAVSFSQEQAVTSCLPVQWRLCEASAPETALQRARRCQPPAPGTPPSCVGSRRAHTGNWGVHPVPLWAAGWGKPELACFLIKKKTKPGTFLSGGVEAAVGVLPEVRILPQASGKQLAVAPRSLVCRQSGLLCGWMESQGPGRATLCPPLFVLALGRVGILAR